MENQSQISSEAFLNQYSKDQDEEIDDIWNEIEEAEYMRLEDSEDESDKFESDLMISKLCRVCANRGQIYIHSTAYEKYLSIPKSNLSKKYDVSIAFMIEELSSIKVEKSDMLPQFICPLCLSYLQHAYNIRLQIMHTSKNLTEVRKIANDESLQLEKNTTPKLLTANQLEIINTKEETEHDQYWYENFAKKNVKIKLQSPIRKLKIEHGKVLELKCPGCFKKTYGVRSHNEHMRNCLVNVIKIFFGEFQTLYQNRFAEKITNEEYLINSLSLIFNVTKKIKKIAKQDKIDIESVSRISPEIKYFEDYSVQSNFKPYGQNYSSSNHWSSRINSTGRFPSPDDKGYYSNTQ